MHPNARDSLLRRARWHTMALVAAAGIGTTAVAATAYAATIQPSSPAGQGTTGSQSQQNPGSSNDDDDHEDDDQGPGIFGLQLSPGGGSDGGSHSS